MARLRPRHDGKKQKKSPVSNHRAFSFAIEAAANRDG
jgi:hypothetical protein